MALNDRVAEQLLVVAEGLAQSEIMLDALRSRLLVQNRPPLWAAWGDEAQRETAPFSERVRASLSRDLNEIQERFDEEAVLRVIVLPLLASILLAYAMRRRALSWGEDDEDVRSATRLFMRPIAAAMLLWPFLTPLPYGASSSP